VGVSISSEVETLAALLIDEVICRFGVPHYIHSVQGANLTSNLMAAVCEHLGISKPTLVLIIPGEMAKLNDSTEHWSLCWQW